MNVDTLMLRHRADVMSRRVRQRDLLSLLKIHTVQQRRDEQVIVTEHRVAREYWIALRKCDEGSSMATKEWIMHLKERGRDVIGSRVLYSVG